MVADCWEMIKDADLISDVENVEFAARKVGSDDASFNATSLDDKDDEEEVKASVFHAVISSCLGSRSRSNRGLSILGWLPSGST